MINLAPLSDEALEYLQWLRSFAHDTITPYPGDTGPITHMILTGRGLTRKCVPVEIHQEASPYITMYPSWPVSETHQLYPNEEGLALLEMVDRANNSRSTE